MSPSRSFTATYATFHLLLCCFLTLRFSFALDPNLRFSFSSFHQNEQSLLFSENSNVDHQALQVTRNVVPVTGDISKSSGQVTYASNHLQLWHSSYNYCASFNTSFLLNMNELSTSTANNATGGGMTFFVSSHPAFSYLPDSYGQWLGLFNGSVAPSQQQARLVAIEFDTFKDSFDPDANHVGIDVNGSVESAYNVSLSPLDVWLTNASDSSGTNTSVWIDYDGEQYTLDVYLANQGSQMSEKPGKPVISQYSIDLRNYLPEAVYVGFSASLGTILEAHCVLEWNFTSSDYPSTKTSYTGIIIGGILGGATIIVLVIILLMVFLVRRRRLGWAYIMEDLTNLHYGPRRFSYNELKKATKGFSEECKLGGGGFGAVYKGVLSSNSMVMEVAVKCLSPGSKQGEREFKAEVMSMGRMRHKNLVQLLGWSYTGRSKLMLVYEYMPNGSLDKWIKPGKERKQVLNWKRRYHVMKDLAAGLFYLHEDWEMVVVHRDLKPSNVMLDAEFNARIGDFGLAKLIKFEQHRAETRTIAGTPGYIAPECMEQGIISKESDIYSIGAIAIELATGRRLSLDYLHTLYLLLENLRLHEAADPQLVSFDPTELELLLKIGLACCHPHPPARPSIRDVVHALSSSSITFSVPAIASPSLTSALPQRQRSSSSTSGFTSMEISVLSGR